MTALTLVRETEARVIDLAAFRDRRRGRVKSNRDAVPTVAVPSGSFDDNPRGAA